MITVKSWAQEFFTSTRFKSFCWHALAQAVAALLAYAAAHTGDLHLSEFGTVLLGLVIAQATKAANNAAQAE